MSEVWKSYISSSQMRLLGGTSHMYSLTTTVLVVKWKEMRQKCYKCLDSIIQSCLSLVSHSMQEETIEIVEERCVTVLVYQLLVLSQFYEAGAY